jgi:CheY-like chemotaxis protein
VAPRTERSENPAKILLVDDNRHGLLARTAILEELGYALTVCSDPEEALRLFQESPHDLVITDYRMPGMTGVELILKLRQVSGAVPTILVSGFVDTLGLTEENTGADAVIQKSANEVSQLLRAVTRVLRRANSPKKPAGRAGGPPPPKAKGRGTS